LGKRLFRLIAALLTVAGGVAGLSGAAASTPARGAHHPEHARHHRRPHHHLRPHHHRRPHQRRHPHHHRHHRPISPGGSIRVLPVSFAVINRNTSKVPCQGDGGRYTIVGSLVLPKGPVPAAVTLYAHGLGFGGWFWQFDRVAGYDYARAEAGFGHASVVIDRLGYGDSSILPGTASCVGAQASILHQIVGQLRSGSYVAFGFAGWPAFRRIGLVGHSAGGQLAENEAYSFRDIDALGVVDWADQGFSPAALGAFLQGGAQCLLQGGAAQRGSTVRGYAPFGQTEAQFDSLMFAGADPAVVSAAGATRTLDPCGDVESILGGVAIDLLMDGTIRVPIAYVHGERDAVFISGVPWAQLQEKLYSGSAKVTDVTLSGVGHAVTLERSAPRLQAAMNAWLTANRL
jgi:Alpha/beta hydrolase family